MEKSLTQKFMTIITDFLKNINIKNLSDDSLHQRQMYNYLFMNIYNDLYKIYPQFYDDIYSFIIQQYNLKEIIIDKELSKIRQVDFSGYPPKAQEIINTYIDIYNGINYNTHWSYFQKKFYLIKNLLSYFQKWKTEDIDKLSDRFEGSDLIKFKNLKETYYLNTTNNPDIYSKLKNDLLTNQISRKDLISQDNYTQIDVSSLYNKSNLFYNSELFAIKKNKITYQKFFSFIFGIISEVNIDLIINFIKIY